MGDSSLPQIISILQPRSVASIRGLENLLCFVRGACAPGFMLPPASQVKTALFVQSHSSMLSTSE